MKNVTEKIPPRKDRISWDNHHMMIAVVASMRSPDPQTQVGACIVSPDNKVLATGYNSFPRGIPVYMLNWSRDDEDPFESKYTYVVHAEQNAILNATSSLKGGTLYTTLYPCNECMKSIIQVGIKEIVYQSDKYKDTLFHKASEKMADIVGIQTRQYSIEGN